MASEIPNFLLVYATSEGQAEKIALDIAGIALQKGTPTACVAAASAPPPQALERYSGIVLVASIHRGRHQQEAYDFVRANLSLLKAKRTALISVSLSAAGNQADRAEAATCVERFLKEVDWTPTEIRLIAGAFRFSQYGFFKRQVMKAIAAAKGIPVDGTDRELTDWEEVSDFAKGFLSRLESTSTKGAA